MLRGQSNRPRSYRILAWWVLLPQRRHLVTHHQNTRVISATTMTQRLDSRHSQFTRGSAGSAHNLSAVLSRANILDRSRNLDVIVQSNIEVWS